METGGICLTCENDSVFYLPTEDSVLVLRILHQRQASIRALFLSDEGWGKKLPMMQ